MVSAVGEPTTARRAPLPGTGTSQPGGAYLNAYYRLTEAADVQVGRLLEALRQQDLEGSTLVLFTSNHGEGIAAHRWVTKLMLYEEPL